MLDAGARARLEDLHATVANLLVPPTFAYFGMVLPFAGWSDLGAMGVVFALVVFVARRPPAVLAALAGSDVPRRGRTFLAWFGQLGVVAMYYATLAETYEVPAKDRISAATTLVIVGSVVARGLTATPGVLACARSPVTDMIRDPPAVPRRPRRDADLTPGRADARVVVAGTPVSEPIGPGAGGGARPRVRGERPGWRALPYRVWSQRRNGGDTLRTLFVHPSALMYSELFLRLEPLGIERVAAAARAAGHEVRVVDLQVFGHRELERQLGAFRPEAVAFGVNYLANVPEAIDLARRVKERLPGCFVFVGGHSVSFIARHLVEQADGAIDAIVRGEGEVITPMLLDAARDGDLHTLPGVVTGDGAGPAPLLLDSLDDVRPARDLMRRRRKYFIGELDPCASIEFTRGCPWDCSFCSAWTFYGRAYRKASPEAAGEELETIREPNVFIVDDVAFIKAEHGDGIAAEIERRRIRKRYYLETRSDVLLRHPEVFARWRRLGLAYMFLGIEALDEEGLDRFRKRVSPDDNMRALELARRLGIFVAINLIVDPAWDARRFQLIREFALSVPNIVHLTVKTPYPGTEIWHTESRKLTTRDYRLFDIQHAVLPTAMPLAEFYEELVRTQAVLSRKHLGLAAVARTAARIGLQLAHGQTNFARMIWRFDKVYNPRRQLGDHARPVHYELPEPPAEAAPRDRRALYIHSRA